MAHDVFLSHSSRNKTVADAMCAVLESAGIRCWAAPRDVPPGATWADAITGAIRESRAFVLIFSSDSNRSPQVLREVDQAVQAGVPLFPFRIDETAASPALDFYIRVAHWLDALTPPLTAHLHRLRDALKALLESAGPTGPPPPPPEPPARHGRRRLIVAVVLAVLLIAGGAYALLRDREHSRPTGGSAGLTVKTEEEARSPTVIDPWRDVLDAAVAAAGAGDWETASKRLAEAKAALAPAAALPAMLLEGVAYYEEGAWRAFLQGWAEAVGSERDAATRYPKRIRRTKDGAVMVLIPAGTFQMGAVPGDVEAHEDEKPRHEVTLSKAYYMDEHEVTLRQWSLYLAGGGGTFPDRLRGESTDAHPIHKVTWSETVAFARWAGATLPTEAQWERAAKGGHDDYVYPWGTADQTSRRNVGGSDDGFGGIAPVKSYAPNDFGLYDMSGNVWERCADLYDSAYYRASPTRDPLGPQSGLKSLPGADSDFSGVVRGGGWGGDSAVRVSHRISSNAFVERFDGLGFRLTKSL